MRCILDLDDNRCNGCRRRGFQCISQEFPEEATLSNAGSTAHDHSGKTLATPSEDNRRTSHSNEFPTPVSVISDPLASLDFYAPSKARIRHFEGRLVHD
jgi:hypothetical protein